MIKHTYKIAVLNCYLQGGHKKIAESEAFIRFKTAANNLCHEAKLFSKSEDIINYRPDFVVCHTYQDPKLTEFPTYGTLTMPPSWVSGIERFERNIATYDSFIAMSDTTFSYVEKMLKEKFNKKVTPIYSAFSVPRTDFVELDYSNAFAAYMGTNWDGSRHGDFFTNFKKNNFLKCYGPKEKWNYLPKNVYGGQVPFDGTSFLKTYRNSGIGLCFNHSDFDFEGIPTSRAFEIPASSAIMISSENKLIKEIYGDSVLYVNQFCTKDELAKKVIEKIKWVKENPEAAKNMARKANEIFNQKISMEILLQNIIDFHENNKSSRLIESNSNKESRITIITTVNHLNYKHFQKQIESILNQETKPFEVIAIINLRNNSGSLVTKFKNRFKKKLDKIIKNNSDKINIKTILTKKSYSLNNSISSLVSLNSDYVNIVNASCYLYPNHLSSISKQLEQNPDVITTGMAQISSSELKELIKDDYCVKKNEKMRLLCFGKIKNCDDLHTESLTISKHLFETEKSNPNHLIYKINELIDKPLLLEKKDQTNQLKIVNSPYVTILSRH